MTSRMKLLSGILTLHLVMALTGCGINELPSVAEKTPAFTTGPTVPVTENTTQGTDTTEETVGQIPMATTQPQVKENSAETRPTESPASQVPEAMPTEPVDTAPPETEPMETVPPPTQQPAATEPSIPPATEPPPTVPPVIEPAQPPTEASEPIPTQPIPSEPIPIEPAPTEPTPTEPVECSHDWKCIHHDEEGHWLAGIICDCGWVIYGSPDEVSAAWNAHSVSFPPEESLIEHGGFGCVDEWVVDAPAYEEWHCSLCGVQRT